MGLFEQILASQRDPGWTPKADAAFPELTPTAKPAEEDGWQWPETMLPPEKRKLKPGVPDASSAGIKLALESVPGIGAGMLTGVDPSPFLNPTERAMQKSVGGDPGPDVPMPAARPVQAPGPVYPNDGSSPAPAGMAIGGPTDVTSRGRGNPPLQVAPPAAAEPPAAPAAAQREPFGLPSILDNLRTTLGNNSNTLLAIGAGLAGAPNVGQGISRAAAAAIPARAADIKQSLDLQSRSTGMRALIEAGVPVQQAIAAQGNPELQKALIQNYITDRKHELKTVKDWMGNESLVDFDPFTSKAKPVTFEGQEGAGGGAPGFASNGIMAAAKMEPNYDPKTNRDEDFLEAVRKADPLTASAIQDVADGKMPATGRNLQKIMPMVSRYEQGFEANRYSARQSLEKSYYGGGEGGKALRAANTTIDHGLDLKKAIDDLHNYSVMPGFLNEVTGKMSENMGNKKYQDALSRFKANAALYSKELEVALTGKSTVSGQKELRDMFNEYAAPTSNQAALQQTLGMLEKRVNEHENTYNTGMNKPNHTFNNDMLSNRKRLDSLLAGDTGSGVKEKGAGAAPKPGKYIFDPATKQMVPR